MLISRSRGGLAICAVLLVLCKALVSDATVVRFTSNVGTFDVRLFDTVTPLSVTNILNYVNSGDFDDSLVHRVDTSFVQQPDGSFVKSPFVIQGGNYAFPVGGLITSIPSNAPVQNEPGISNLRGTFALARAPGGVNSGTNNWFVNVKDNAFLDNVDEGFTVFGKVVGDGMQTVDIIADIRTVTVRNQFGQTLGSSFPVLGDPSLGLSRDDFVLFSSVEDLNIPDGDYDFDADVDGSDFLTWQRGFGSIADVAADGDGNAIVNGADLVMWENGFGATAASAATAVPEPATLLLLGSAALALFGGRRRSFIRFDRR